MLRWKGLTGPGGEPFDLTFEVIDGLAIVAGDIILGTVAEMEELAAADFVVPQSNAVVPHGWGYKGVVYGCKWLRWTDAVVPCTFKDDWGVTSAGTAGAA